MTDYLDALRQMEEIERNRAAQLRLTPPNETPTVDFTDAPATAEAVNNHPNPIPMTGEFERMGRAEQLWNAGKGGVHSLRKSSTMENILGLAQQVEGGVVSSLRDDLEERFGEDEEIYKKFADHLRGSKVDEEFKAEKQAELDEEISHYQYLRSNDFRYPVPISVIRAAQATEGKSFVDSVVPYLSEVAKDPLTYTIYLTGSSMGAIAPSLAMSMVSGKLIGGVFKMGTTARAIQAAMMGYGSYQAEIGGYFEKILEEKGYDLTNPESLQKALETEDLNDLIMRGRRRAATVGLMDAIAAWVAPIRLNPSNALRYLRRAKEAVPTKLVPTTRLYNFGKGAENLAMQTTLQGVLGGAGEAFGQLVNGEQVNWGDVFAEAFGEFTSAPVEVIGLATSANAKFNADSEYCKNANKFNETAKQVTQAVQAVSQTMKEGETLQQWAQKVGEGTPLFAYAQDLVERGISEKIRETNPELADKIEEAARQKTDITLSMGDVLTLATKDESLAQSVVNESRIDADGMSPRQAQEFLKNGKEEAAKKFQEIVDKVKPDVERRREIKTVVDKLRDDLVAQGMTKELADASTMPWTAKLAVLCKQLNTTAEDVMNRLNLQVKRQQAERQQKAQKELSLMQKDIENEITKLANELNITDEELALILEGGADEKKTKEYIEQLAEGKASVKKGKGWDVLEFLGINKAKRKLIWREIPYSFNQDKNGKTLKKGTREYNRKVKSLAEKVHKEVKTILQRALSGDEKAQAILKEAGWYRNMRTELRQTYGAAGDLLADLLGATSPNTPVRSNWEQAVDLMSRLCRGEFDSMIPQWEAWDAKRIDLLNRISKFVDEKKAKGMTNKAIEKDSEYVELVDEAKDALKLPESLMPKKVNGSKYGMNSANAVMAILDHFREVDKQNTLKKLGGTAPKTITFAGNLIGVRDRATIDVWAARFLNRLAGRKRIPSRAEGGVSGLLLPSGETTLQFGFGQDVFHEAAEKIRNDKSMTSDTAYGKDLARLGDDDLQAVVWFVEKEIWEKNDWTTADGAGGSFEYEASFEGNPDRKGIKENRTTANSVKSSAVKKLAALAYLKSSIMYPNRYEAGLSLQESQDTQGRDHIPTDAEQAQAQKELRDAAKQGESGESKILAFQANSTMGMYKGNPSKRSLNVEITVRQGYDPEPLFREVVKKGQQANQDSVFMSRVLREDEQIDYAKHRAGIELYIDQAGNTELIKQIEQALLELGVDSYTPIVDVRQTADARAGKMGKVVGIRFQYIPEFTERYGGTIDYGTYKGKKWSELVVAEVRIANVEIGNHYDDIAKKLQKQFSGITSSKQYWYDTTVVFNNEYNGVLNNANIQGSYSGQNSIQGTAVATQSAGRNQQGNLGGLQSGTQPTGAQGTAQQVGGGQPRSVSVHNIGSEHQQQVTFGEDSILDGVNRAKAYAPIGVQPSPLAQSLYQSAMGNRNRSDIDWVAEQRYMEAVQNGDMETARRMVAEKAVRMGYMNPIPEETKGWKLRTKPAPKKTIKAYKVFFVNDKGEPTTLFVGDSQPVPRGVWLDAQEGYSIVNPKNGRRYVPTFSNPNRQTADGKKKTGKTGETVPIADEQTRQELIDRGFITDKATSVTAVANRPGFHAGTLPYFPQGGERRVGSNYGNVHEPRQVVFEVELSADTDYTETARNQEKARTKDGRVNARNADLDYLPEDGMYRYTTNPMLDPAEDGWVISGSMKIVRALSQEECDKILAEHGKAPQEWSQGEMELDSLGITNPEMSEANRKTLAPVTYDASGNVIPLFMRFNPAIDNVLYQINPSQLQSLLQLAFHGSPYWFEAFSTKNIGSGEGAQAHGWGLYFALNKAVAEAYKKRLNKGEMSVTYKGRPISELEQKLDDEFDAWERKRPLHGGPADGLTDEYIAWSNKYWELHGKRKFIYRLSAPWFDTQEELGYLQGESKDWARNEILPYVERREGATLYTVDIPEDDVMLREELPFEDQPPKVQEALKKLFPEQYSKEKAETERAAWLEEVKNSQAIRDAFWKMPETYKAFIALAEKEGPQAFADITTLMKKLKTASKKDAKVARDANLQNGVDEPLEEVEEDLWSELGNSKLMYPYELANSDKYANLFAYTKSAEAREKNRKAWLTAFRKVIRSIEDDEELMDNTAKGLKKLAKEEGPSIFLDEARLFDKMLPYLRKDAEETFENEKEDRDEDFTLDDWAEELFYNLRDMGNLGLLQDCASKYQVKGEGLRLQGVKGERIYDQLARSLGSEMKASILLSKYGIQGIRYYGLRDGECAVVFDDAMIKIIETLQQLAYHGTGFNDPILKFSLDHVGEGEGAQAHGYGLYFALAKAVAQGYRDKLTNGQYRIGKTDSNEYRTELEAKVKKAKGKHKQKWIDRLTAFDEWHAHKNMDAVKEAHDNGEITDDAFTWFEKEIRPNVQTDGGLYLVDIPEDYEMLDEMLQFEAQPEQVKAALRKLVKNEFSPEQLTKLYKEQWYRDAMYQMEDYSYTFDVPDVVLRALDKLAQEEGPRIFAHEKKVLAKISDALNEAAEEKYLEDQEYYDEQAHGRKKGIDIARDEIIEEGGLNKDGLFWTLHNVAEENYPSLLKGKVKFEFTDSLHGFQIYNQIAEFVGGKKEASALLNKYGIKGIRYNGLDDGECAVVWDEESIKIQERLAQVKAQLESVAAQSARGDFVPNNTATRGNGMGGLMTLMQNADKSTFMHESAHAWLDLDTMLACDIAEKMERGEELTEGEIAFMKNLGGFFRWGQQEGKIDLGVTEDIATVAIAVKRWSQMTVHQQRGMHELFAEGFEAYLYEGVAPNKEMQSIFSRFKAWLKELYQRINYTPMVLSPEVRKLYDLMFASEQQAQDTETRMGFRALITAEMGDKLGMTPEELEAYNRLAEQATLETEGLVAKSVHGAMRIFGNLRKGEAERMEREHKEDIEQTEETILAEPRYVAVSLLTDGRYEERDGVMVHTPPVKLMHDDLVNFGIPNDTVLLLAERGWVEAEGTIQMERPHQLEREKAEGFDEVTAGPYRVDGVPIQMFATMCGSDNPIELIGDILEIKSLDDAHKEAVKSVAYKEREEMGENPDKFRELQANLCAYNETRSRLLTAEYNAIARKLGSQQMLVSAARDYAQEQIGNIPVNKLRPKSYMAAERRNIKEAEEAFRKGDFQKALEAKRAQIVNHEMARAAMEAQDRYNKGVNVAKRALKSKTVHPQFKRVVDALLSMHSVKTMTEKEREEFKLGEPLTQDKIDEFVKTLEDNGTPVDGLKGFLGSRTPAVEMTVNESRDFFEIVKEVTALGRNLLMQNLTEERERITDICDKAEVHLSEAADAQNRPIDPHQHVAHTEKQRRHKSLSDFLLSHTKIATWFRIFDQNKAGGFFWNLFIRSANRCANFENEQRAKSAQYLADKFATVFKKNMEEDPVIIDGFAEPFTHGMRLAVALNWGNESNRERLTTNDPRFTPDAIQAIFEHLTEADWRAVEAVWQLFESFRPMIEEKELRVRGIAPEWIEYSPFEVTTAEGKKITVSGGYYPVKYDPEASNTADKYTSADDVEQEMKGAYQSATTRESFIKSRVKGKVTNMPLRLDLNPLYEGLNDVIHDLAWHEWLIDTKKVLDGVPGVQRGLREVIKERYGSQVTREIEMWRTDIAVGGRNPASVTWAAKLASCIGVSTMGYSLTSAVVQLTGMGYVIPRVGVNAFLVGLAKYMSNPFKASKMIREKSKAMNLRNMTQFKEISQIRNRLEQGHGVKTWLHDHAYVLISLVQSIADSVCWLSAYEKYSREETSEAKLIAMCDQVVIDTQSSGNINDLSRIERDRAGLSRLFTIFYSWMNAALNLAVGEYLGETNKFKKTANLLFMCAVMPVVEKAFRDSLTGKDDDDDDDDEEPLKTYVREPLSAIAEYNLGLFTGLTRECASAASNFISGDRIYGYSGPAGVRLMAHANNAFSVASNPNEKKVMKAIIDLLGDLRGIPSVQINRTIKGIRAVNSGQAEGIDAIKAPLFGYKGRVYD